MVNVWRDSGSQFTPGWNMFPVELPAETQLCQKMSPALWGLLGICALGHLLVSDPAGKKAWKKQQLPSQELCPAIPQQKSLLWGKDSLSSRWSGSSEKPRLPWLSHSQGWDSIGWNTSFPFPHLVSVQGKAVLRSGIEVTCSSFLLQHSQSRIPQCAVLCYPN